MPLYWGDYLRDTIGLTHAEHGAYFLSMGAYWTKGEALEMGELRAICGREFERVKRFYVWCDGRWNHKRIDEELKKARDRKEVAREKARKGVEARRAMGQI